MAPVIGGERRSIAIVEKWADAAHFWSEKTTRDAAMDLVSMLVQIFWKAVIKMRLDV